jgi:hypothetical protein
MSAKTLDDALAEIASSPDYLQHNGNLCPIFKIMQAVPDETAERLRALIDETRKPGSLIADKLTEVGYPVSQQSVQRHRRRLARPSAGCKCP